MRERLRHVPEERVVAPVDLLAEEPDVVRERAELVHQRRSLVAAPRPRKRVDEPERTGEERSLVAGDAVGAAIAEHERPLLELALDRLDRPAQPWVIRF